MITGPLISEIAGLVGEPARATILWRCSMGVR